MILSNLTAIIPNAMASQNVSLPATYGGRYTIDGRYLFYEYDIGANGYVSKRMQNYNTNSDPYNTTTSSGRLNVLICVGNGTTPPTADDVKLENAILDLDYLGGACTLSYRTTTVTTTWQNNTGAPITINELGIHCSPDVVGTYSGAIRHPFVILTRSVLEQPVVMQDGESRTFSIAINFNKMLETSTNG